MWHGQAGTAGFVCFHVKVRGEYAFIEDVAFPCMGLGVHETFCKVHEVDADNFLVGGVIDCGKFWVAPKDFYSKVIVVVVYCLLLIVDVVFCDGGTDSDFGFFVLHAMQHGKGFQDEWRGGLAAFGYPILVVVFWE